MTIEVLGDGVSRPIFRSSGAGLTDTDVTNSRSSAMLTEWKNEHEHRQSVFTTATQFDPRACPH